MRFIQGFDRGVVDLDRGRGGGTGWAVERKLAGCGRAGGGRSMWIDSSVMCA